MILTLFRLTQIREKFDDGLGLAGQNKIQVKMFLTTVDCQFPLSPIPNYS